MLSRNNPSLETCVGECNCSSTEFTEGGFWQQASTRLFCAFRVSLLFYFFFCLCFFFFSFLFFFFFLNLKNKTGWLRIWSLTHCMYCFLNLFILILMRNAFLPILVGWFPQSCVKSHWQNKKNYAYDIYILFEMSAERKYLMHWLWV